MNAVALNIHWYIISIIAIRIKHSHVVVTLCHAGTLAEKLPDRIPVVDLSVFHPHLPTWYRLMKICKYFKINLIHARNTSTWFDSSMASLLKWNTKLVLSFHGFDKAVTFTTKQKAKARIGKLSGAKFVSVSKSGADMLAKVLNTSASKIHHIPNGINTNSFEDCQSIPSDIKSEFSLNHFHTVISCVASLSSVKNHEVLIRAFKKVYETNRDCVLLLVGDGPEKEKIATLIKKSGLSENVILTGKRDDVAEILKISDFFVLPSKYEAMSNAILEALSAGLPVIATDVGDNPVLVQNNKNGFIVPANDTHALGEKMSLLCMDESLRNEMSRQSRKHAEQFSIVHTVDKYDSLYESLFKRQSTTNHVQHEIISAAC